MRISLTSKSTLQRSLEMSSVATAANAGVLIKMKKMKLKMTLTLRRTFGNYLDLILRNKLLRSSKRTLKD